MSSAAEEPGAWTVVHDFGFVLAGAERVSQALADGVLRGVPVVTLAADPGVMERMQLSSGWRAVLPRWLVDERRYRVFTPLYPLLLLLCRPIRGNVICSSYAFSHHVRCTGRKVVYCHTPLRQVWSGHGGYLEHAGQWQRVALRATTWYLRRSDRRAAASADLYIAASAAVRTRIAETYGMHDVPVVVPPLDLKVFCPAERPASRSYFLWVGRIVEPYKRLKLTIEAFRGSGHTLVVAGEGRDRRRLEETAPANVEFLGWQGDRELADLYRGAVAVVFPSEDDFGLVPVESMACGTPSVAFAGGGAKETVVEGVTGLFFREQTAESLRAAVDEAAVRVWDHGRIARVGAHYGAPRFVAEVQALLEGIFDEGPGGGRERQQQRS